MNFVAYNQKHLKPKQHERLKRPPPKPQWGKKSIGDADSDFQRATSSIYQFSTNGEGMMDKHSLISSDLEKAMGSQKHTQNSIEIAEDTNRYQPQQGDIEDLKQQPQDKRDVAKLVRRSRSSRMGAAPSQQSDTQPKPGANAVPVRESIMGPITREMAEQESRNYVLAMMTKLSDSLTPSPDVAVPEPFRDELNKSANKSSGSKSGTKISEFLNSRINISKGAIQNQWLKDLNIKLDRENSGSTKKKEDVKSIIAKAKEQTEAGRYTDRVKSESMTTLNKSRSQAVLKSQRSQQQPASLHMR